MNILMDQLMIFSVLLLVFCGVGSQGEKPTIRLGYLTGSQKRPNDLFYNKPGQSISGAITLAVKVSGRYNMHTT